MKGVQEAYRRFYRLKVWLGAFAAGGLPMMAWLFQKARVQSLTVKSLVIINNNN